MTRARTDTETPIERDDASDRPRLAWSTAVFSLATGLSRVLGLVREIVARRYFGVDGPGINAFTVAFQIPNLVRALVADAALSSAFVPVFSELLDKGDRKRAWRVASSLFWLLLLGLGALTALFVLVAPLLIRPFDVQDEALAVTLSRILFPIVALLGVSGIVVGILNSYDHFSVPALTPVFWNIAIIVGLVIGVPRADGEVAELYVYAGSILVGTVIQVLLPVPWLRGRDDRLRVAIDWRDPAVRRVFVLMGPVTLGLGLINFNQVIGTLFAARLIDRNLAPAAIDAAFRIYMLPQGMFSVAIATVLFPSLARFAARADLVEFRRTVATGIRQIAFLLVPASVAAAVLAEPIVRLLYQRGDFDPEETPVVAAALAAFSLGLTFNGMMLMLNRGFFSLQQPWTPTAVALGNLALNTVLYAAFYRLGIWGIPLAISVANVAGAGALLVLLRRRIERIDFADTARAVLRIVAASAGLAAVAYPTWLALDGVLGRSFPAQLGSVGAALAAGLAVYAISCRLLGVRELDALLSLRARLARR
ncbi:MAG: murein biosynthesis integral membrane protein MurJ [Actinomycetota bacterium]|nr:murein biosynthesis integral membrane protein MurJ [Actinomycetota bacterium]